MNTTATSDSSFKQESEWTSGLLAGLLLGIIITIIIMFLLKRRRRRRQLTTTINLGKGRDSRHIRRIKLAAKSNVDLRRSVKIKIHQGRDGIRSKNTLMNQPKTDIMKFYWTNLNQNPYLADWHWPVFDMSM